MKGIAGRNMNLLIIGIVVAGWLALGANGWSSDFYQGKRASIIVPFGPGGGWDTYARLTARHIGRYIPGKPSFIVQNMPGAGGMVSYNHLFNRTEPDGLTLGMFQTVAVMTQLAGDPAVKFDARRILWVGAFTDRASVCVARSETPFKTIKDVIGSKEAMHVGSTGRGDALGAAALLLNEVLGTNFNVISGYKGTADVRGALERGELHGLCGWGWSSVKATGMNLIEEGKLRILLQIGERPHPEIPKDVPLVTQLVSDKNRPLLNAYLIPEVIGWNLILPPNVPSERVEIMRDGFNRLMKDPGFLGEAERAKLDIAPMSGPAIAKMFEQLFKEATPDVIARLKKIM
jgi:tripartite-type tricarboxylate transporter receptor subunit TctC